MGKVRTVNPSLPTPIEQYLSSQDNFSIDDLEALKTIAALQEDIPTSEMIPSESSSPVIKLFQTSSEQEKRNSIHFARNEIANRVLDSDSPEFLNHIAQFF